MSNEHVNEQREAQQKVQITVLMKRNAKKVSKRTNLQIKKIHQSMREADLNIKNQDANVQEFHFLMKDLGRI